MKIDMQQQVTGFLKSYLPFTVILFAIQYGVVHAVLEMETYYATLSIYAFHFVASLLVYLIVLWVHENFKDKAGFAFMGLGLVKTLAALIFLLPLLLGDSPNKFVDLMTFFIPYFLFLIFETLFVVRKINEKPD